MKKGLFTALCAGCILLNSSNAVTKIDTIGNTGVDAQNYGPIWQRIVHLPGTGIYTAWIKTGMFANFFSFTTHTWSGEVEVFPAQRNASGSLAVLENPASPYYRSTFVSSFINRNPKWPILAVESLPGSGTFVMRPPDSSLLGCTRPPIAFTGNSGLHLLCADSATQDTLLYSRSTDFGITWSRPIALCGDRVPAGPTYNLAGSNNSLRIAAVWSHPDSGALWLNISDDGGTTWSGVQNIFPPPTSISSPKPGKFGAYCIFDHADRLNIVTQVWNGTEPYPAEIWHWQEGRTPEWTLIFRFAPHAVLAPPEPGEPCALRPTLATRVEDGRLFVLWQNYDSLNYETSTQIARADLFVAQSENNGINWSRPLRLTGPDNYSRLSPCLAARATDSLYIITVVDQVAGVYETGHGPQTLNPVCVLRVPVSDLPGIAENRGGTSPSPACPTIQRQCGFTLKPGTTLYSVLGQPVHSAARQMGSRHITPGAGIYFLLSPEGTRVKILLLR